MQSSDFSWEISELRDILCAGPRSLLRSCSHPCCLGNSEGYVVEVAARYLWQVLQVKMAQIFFDEKCPCLDHVDDPISFTSLAIYLTCAPCILCHEASICACRFYAVSHSAKKKNKKFMFRMTLITNFRRPPLSTQVPKMPPPSHRTPRHPVSILTGHECID